MTEPPIALLPALPNLPTALLPAPLPRPAASQPAQAHSDEHLLALWLHGRSAATQRAYAADLRAFLAHVARPLQAVTLGDVQAFQDTLATLAPATEARRLSAGKSLARAMATSCVAWASAGVSGWRGLALLARP